MNMSYLTTTEAAKLVKKDPSTIKRWASNGKLSCHKNENGQRMFDPAELYRVFNLPAPVERAEMPEQKVQRTGMPAQMSALHEAEKAALQAKIDALEERLRDKDRSYEENKRTLERALDETRSERDEWRDQAKQQTRLLEHHQKKQDEQSAQPKKGFFRRLVGA